VSLLDVIGQNILLELVSVDIDPGGVLWSNSFLQFFFIFLVSKDDGFICGSYDFQLNINMEGSMRFELWTSDLDVNAFTDYNAITHFNMGGLWRFEV
jgi:hypothetical protein